MASLYARVTPSEHIRAFDQGELAEGRGGGGVITIRRADEGPMGAAALQTPLIPTQPGVVPVVCASACVDVNHA